MKKIEGKIEKWYTYMSSAVRFIRNYEKKYGCQNFTINKIDEDVYLVESNIIKTK